MSVDRAEVERISHLARLALDEGELDRLTGDMNDILEHAATLRELGRTAPSARVGDGPLPSPAAGAPEAAAGFGGTRGPGAETPDRLHARPEAFAPKTAEGFFLVPPPPGVEAAGEP